MRAAEKHTASDAIVAAFADALLGTQMPEPREVVTLDLADLTTASPVDGPARCERKRAPR